MKTLSFTPAVSIPLTPAQFSFAFQVARVRKLLGKPLTLEKPHKLGAFNLESVSERGDIVLSTRIRFEDLETIREKAETALVQLRTAEEGKR